MDHEQNQEDRLPKPEPSTTDPVRSRWTPKPEQIQVLENIFNSGTVNPTKDETVKIRRILEQYGSVGDANVFYWFQNRRSRSRRRLRQLQAAAAAANMNPYDQMAAAGASNCTPSSSNNSNNTGLLHGASASSPCVDSASFVDGYSEHDWFSSVPCVYSSDSSHLQLNPGTITVFINGMPTEVPRGAVDMRAMFGPDVVLVHSSGEVLPANEYGVLIQSLQMGESYFLVSKSS